MIQIVNNQNLHMKLFMNINWSLNINMERSWIDIFNVIFQNITHINDIHDLPYLLNDFGALNLGTKH